MNILPDTWSWSTIGEVADIVRGVTYSKGDTLLATDKDAVPLLRATNLEVDSIDFEDMVYVPKRVVKAQHLLQMNDIFLAASSGSISVVGKSAQVIETKGATFGAFCAVIRPKNIHPKFLAYWVQSPTIRDHWSATAKGTNINNLKPSDISETNIPIPPIAEQHKIVELLEGHLLRLDSALADVKQARVKAVQFRRSLFQAAFTGDLIFVESGLETETLGGWRKERFGDVFKVKYGKAIDKSLRMEYAEFPVVGSAGIMTYTKTPLTSEPTIVIGRKGNVGSIQIFKEGCYPIDTTYYMPTIRDLDIDFLTYQLTSLELVRLDSSTATPSLRREDLENVQVVIPPMEEQLEIVALIKNHLSLLDAAITTVDALEKHSNTLRRSLLQAAFTGQLTKEVASV
jgi:type I restriction enzyme S subunit